jgi:hypothetical protein
MTQTEFRVLRQIRIGAAKDLISPVVRERLKSMGLIEEIDGGFVITDEGLRGIATGEKRRPRVK